MSQPQQRQLLDLPKTLLRSQNQENQPARNRARSTNTHFEEEMRAMPIPLIERRNTNSNVPIRSPNIATLNDFAPTTDCLERLYQVTDVVLVICGIVVIIAVLISIGIGILGISRKLQGLGYHTDSFYRWE